MSVDELSHKLGKLPLEKPILIDTYLLYSAGPLFLGLKTRQFPKNPDLKLMDNWYENIIALLAEDNIFVTKQTKRRYATSNALTIEAERMQEKSMTGENFTEEREALKLARKYQQEISEKLTTKTTTARINPELIDLTLNILQNLGIMCGRDTEREELVATAFAHTINGNPCGIASSDPYITQLFAIYTTMFFSEESLLYTARTNPTQIELHQFRRQNVHKVTAAKCPYIGRELRATPTQITSMIERRIHELIRTDEEDPILKFYLNQRNNK